MYNTKSGVYFQPKPRFNLTGEGSFSGVSITHVSCQDRWSRAGHVTGRTLKQQIVRGKKHSLTWYWFTWLRMWSLMSLSTGKAFPHVVQGNCSLFPVFRLLTWSKNLALLEKRPPQVGQPTLFKIVFSNIHFIPNLIQQFSFRIIKWQKLSPTSPGCDSACARATLKLQWPLLHKLWDKTLDDFQVWIWDLFAFLQRH